MFNTWITLLILFIFLSSIYFAMVSIGKNKMKIDSNKIHYHSQDNSVFCKVCYVENKIYNPILFFIKYYENTSNYDHRMTFRCSKNHLLEYEMIYDKNDVMTVHIKRMTERLSENTRNQIIELEDQNKKLLDKLNLLENELDKLKGLNIKNIEPSAPIEEINTLIPFSPEAIEINNAILVN